MNSQEVKEILELVSLATTTTANIDTYRNLCFRDGQVSAFNGEFGIICKSPLEINCCVSATMLLNVLKNIPGEFEIKDEGNSISIVSGSFRSVIATSDNVSFPKILPENLVPMPQVEALFSVMKLVSFCCGDSEKFLHFHGVGVKDNKIYATDGKRAARLELPVSCTEPFVLPKKALKIAEKLGDTKTFFRSENVLVFAYPERSLILVCCLESGKCPFEASDSVFDSEIDPNYDVELPEELPAIINRVVSISKNRTSRSILVGCTENTLLIGCDEKELGASNEMISWKCPYEFTFYINADYLLEVLEITHKANLQDIVCGQSRFLRFKDGSFQCMVALQEK